MLNTRRQVMLKQFGDDWRISVSTIEQEFKIDAWSLDPPAICYETMIFWKGHALDGHYIATYNKSAAREAHQTMIDRVEAAAMEVTSGRG